MDIEIGNWKIARDGGDGFVVREFGASTKGENIGKQIQKGPTRYYPRLAQALERVMEQAAFDDSATVAAILAKLADIERNVYAILEGHRHAEQAAQA